jgi:membrane protein DedA with SNARE-associated domain
MYGLLAHIDLDKQVLTWVARGGYPVLFGLLFACGLGLPLPEDIPLLAAGAMVGAGKFNLAITAVCGWLGIIGGDCVLYHLGKRYGMEVTRLPFVGRHLTMSRILWVEQRFKRYGIWVVAVGRLFAGVRGAMVVCAGAIRFPLGRFLVADGIAAIFSGGIFLSLGYWFGSRMDWLREHVTETKKWVTLGLIIVLLIGGVWVWWRNHIAPKLAKATATPAPPPTPAVAEEPTRRGSL